MSKILARSPRLITANEIDWLLESLRNSLEKSGLGPYLHVLREHPADFFLSDELIDVVRRHLEIDGLIIRKAYVDRNRQPKEVLDSASLFRRSGKESVIATMPRGIEERVYVIFFPCVHDISDDDLQKKYVEYGLKLDPYAHTAVNEADPTLADRYTNVSRWGSCELRFGRITGSGRYARCDRVVKDGSHSQWSSEKTKERYWFAGVPL